MAYALESMLRIRAMREDRASEALVAARHAQEVAAAQVADCESRYTHWTETKESRRDAVFAAIMGVPVRRADIDLAKEAVSRIDEEGVMLQDGVVRAKADLATKEEESEKARGRFVVATREHEKISQHREIWLAEERKAQEYAAEAELEEFTGRRLVDDDDDALD